MRDHPESSLFGRRSVYDFDLLTIISLQQKPGHISMPMLARSDTDCITATVNYGPRSVAKQDLTTCVMRNAVKSIEIFLRCDE